MVLTYNKMKELLPRNTMKVVDDVLPYLKEYIGKRKDVHFYGTDDCSEHKFSKSFFLLLYAANQDKEMNTLLSKFGFKPNKYDFGISNIDFNASREQLFNDYSYIVPIFKDPLEYETLTPSNLVMYWYSTYKGKCSSTIFDIVFDASTDSFVEMMNKQIKREKEEREHKLALKIYESLPISVINYLETASKIRSILHVTKYDIKDLKTTNEDDITALSLFLALYNYNDLEHTSDGISLSKLITASLNRKGVRGSELDIRDSQKLDNIAKNIYAIKKYFTRYYKDGCNKNKDTSEITVLDICNNLFDRNFTNSIVVEKLLSSYGIDINELKNFKDIIESSIEETRMQQEAKKIETFYSRTNKSTRAFLETSSKVYSLLLKKMEDKKHNYMILTDEDDADTLSILIASYMFDTDVSKFYRNHGIEVEQILEYVGIDLSVEEIEREDLNERTLINRFQRFAFDGVNKDKESKKVSINEISYNLCNRDFNKTTIMEDIFNSLSNDTSIEADFLDQLKKELLRNEKIRKMNLAQKLFKNASNEQIKFYELVSKYHQFFSSKLRSSYTEDDIKTLSLLFSILSRDDAISELIEDIGITKNRVLDYLNINSVNLDNYNGDIDIIANEYVPYVKKTENSENIGETPIYNIAKNLFKKESNDSINITRLLGSFDLSSESFDNFDKLYEGLTLKSKILGYNYDTNTNVKLAIQLFDYFREKRDNLGLDLQYVKTDADIATLSFLIAMIDNYTYRDTFMKVGITKKSLLEFANLSEYSLRNISERRVNYKLAEDYLLDYLPKDKRMVSSDIIRGLFDKSINNSYFIENIIPKKSDYKALKYEVETGKDYEDSLTVDDRISILNNQKVDSINVYDISSILEFGSSLKTHAKVIYEELPKLALSDTNEKSVETIKSLTTQVYTQEEPKKRSIIGRLFSVDKEQLTPRITINHEALGTLKDTINENVVQLSGEVHGYDAIRKYLEAYIKKNQEHSAELEKHIKRLSYELEGLNPQNKNDYARYLQLSSILQVLKDKSNRFKTTIRIAEQDLIRINQSIVSHFITINSLDMAKTDLLPLIGAELAIAQGRMTEKGALDLSKNVIGLFNALLTGNAEETMEGMRLLQESNIPQEVIETISQDIESHMQGLKRREELAAIEERPLLVSPTPAPAKKKNRNKR